MNLSAPGGGGAAPIANKVFTDKIIKLMPGYNGSDLRRINHALKVFVFAQTIGHGEKCDERTQTIIEYASILHDIGLHKAEETGKTLLDSMYLKNPPYSA